MAGRADYTARDGGVFIRGVFHTDESCERLLAIFRAEQAQGGWWAKEARALGDQLEAAMRAAMSQRQHERAA